MDPKTGEVGLPDKSVPDVPYEKPDAAVNPRFKALEEIARRREEERKADNEGQNFDVLDEDGNITSAPEKTTKPEETPAPVESADTPADESPVETVKETAPQEPEPEETRDLVVDGKTIKVPLSKILDAGVRTFQKETAADLRLAAASELERQARQRFQPPVETQRAEHEKPATDDAELAHAIQFGTEEQAKEAIAKLRGSTGKIPTANEVRNFVQQSIMKMVPETLQFQDANNWVRTEYKEIFADPMLEQQFMLSENARRANGDARPHRELYKELAETMTTKFHLRETPTATPDGADRIVRKANSPRPVQAAGGQKPPSAPTRQPTVTDFVEKQRQLRGLAPLPRKDQSI